MNIAFISDIHSNLPALEAVLDDMPPVDCLACAGDIIGYNPWPAAVTELVREHADVVIAGNHDEHVHSPVDYHHNVAAWEGLELANERLSADQLDWLSSLSDRAQFENISMVHSHPDPEKKDEYIFPGDEPELADFIPENTLLVTGHTHVQHYSEMDWDDSTGAFLNPGSVGQPRDHDWRAAYALYDTDTGDVDLRRVEYDFERVVNEIHRVGLPTKSARRLTPSNWSAKY